MSAAATTRATRAFRPFRQSRNALARTFARQIASDSFPLVGFEDEITNVGLSIDDVTFDSPDVTVSGWLFRDADSAIPEDLTLTLFLDGVAVDSSSGRSPAPQPGFPYDLSGTGEAGDSVRVELTGGQHFEGGPGTAQVTAIVPTPSGGGGGGNGGGGGDLNGGIDLPGDGENGGGDVEPGEIVLQDVTVTPVAPTLGQTVTITVTAENVGDQATVRSFNVEAGATPLTPVEFEIGGGGQAQVQRTFTPTSAGTTPVQVGALSETVTVAGDVENGGNGGGGGGGIGDPINGGGNGDGENGDGAGGGAPGDGDGGGTGALAVGAAGVVALLALVG